MRFLVLGLLLGLAACSSSMSGSSPMGPGGIFGGSPAPLPTTGPIAYTCADGTQLMVDTHGGNAQVAIVGGPSMSLPSAGTADAPYYSNGRYGFRGGGASAQWEVGRSAPVACRGG